MLNFSCKYAIRLLDKISCLNANTSYQQRVDVDKVKKAIYCAMKYHGDQKRQSGEPYYSHPLEVAYIVSNYVFNTDVIVTSILHDTIEDTELTFEMIKEMFGGVIARNVMDLTRIKDNGVKISSAQMIVSLYEQKKYDMLLIKQIDRLHNIQTLGVKSPDKKKKIIAETMYAFAPLSMFLGIKNIEDELICSCIEYSNTNAEDKVINIMQENDKYLLSLIVQSTEPDVITKNQKK